MRVLAALFVLSVLLPAHAEPPAKARVVLVGDSTVASKSGWGDAFGKLLGGDVYDMPVSAAKRRKAASAKSATPTRRSLSGRSAS